MAPSRHARAHRPQRRPDPEPLEVDEPRVILIGTIAWAVTFVGLLIFYPALEDRGNEWWPWTAAAGLGLGCWGWFLVRKRAVARAARRSGDAAAPPAS